MANYCDIKLQLPTDIPGQFPGPPFPAGLVPLSYMGLLQALRDLDQADINQDSQKRYEILEKLNLVSTKKGYWLYNDFNLPTNYSLPIYGTKTFKEKETSGIINDPIDPHTIL